MRQLLVAPVGRVTRCPVWPRRRSHTTAPPGAVKCPAWSNGIAVRSGWLCRSPSPFRISCLGTGPRGPPVVRLKPAACERHPAGSLVLTIIGLAWPAW